MNYIFCAPINLVEHLMNSFATILTTSVPIGLHAITFINNIHFIIQMTTISVMIIVNRLSARYGCTQHFNTPHSTISRRTPLHALPLNNLMHYNIDWIHSDEIHFNFWCTQKYWHCYQYLIALKLSGSTNTFVTDDFYPSKKSNWENPCYHRSILNLINHFFRYFHPLILFAQSIKSNADRCGGLNRTLSALFIILIFYYEFLN